MKFRTLFQRGLKNPGAVLPVLLNLPKFIRLYFRLLKDPRVRVWPKILFVATLIYFISPVDLFSEMFIPLFGYIDDVVLLIAMARYFLNAAPPEVVSEHVAAIQPGREIQ